MELGNFAKRVRENVERTGFHVTGVFPRQGEEGPSFLYTGGFTKTLDAPEILMMGFDPQLMHSLTHEVFNAVREGRVEIPPTGGKVDGIIRGYPVLFRPVPDGIAEVNTRVAEIANGAEGHRVMQMLLPDAEGRFPGEPDCDPRYEELQNIFLLDGFEADDAGPYGPN